MKISVNGEEAFTQEPVSIATLISQRKINPAAVVVEYNGAILACCDWGKIELKESDTLEIISFVGGG
jgi:thiamine biosynthesis protein ThiS